MSEIANSYDLTPLKVGDEVVMFARRIDDGEVTRCRRARIERIVGIYCYVSGDAFKRCSGYVTKTGRYGSKTRIAPVVPETLELLEKYTQRRQAEAAEFEDIKNKNAAKRQGQAQIAADWLAKQSDGALLMKTLSEQLLCDVHAELASAGVLK